MYNTFVRQTLHYFSRPHVSVPTSPIRGPSAWRADELIGAPWIEQLDDDEVAELERAAERLKGRDMGTITRDDFELPGLSKRIPRWLATLRNGRGFLVVRGLPVDRWNEETSSLVFWGLGHHLGLPGAQNDDHDLLGHVRDVGADPDHAAVRGYKTAAHLGYHCDAADVVGLLCLNAAKEGGRSQLVSSVTVFNEVLTRRPDLAPRLFEPMLLDTHAEGGLRYIPIPPCTFDGETLRTFYHADYFRTARRAPGAPPADDLEAPLLDLYDEICADPNIAIETTFEPGDVQLLSNHTLLHSRTSYVDFEEPQKKRHLLRLWLSLPAPQRLSSRLRTWRATARLLRTLGRERLRQRKHVNVTA